MKPQNEQNCTAFANHRLIAVGPMVDVALAAKAQIEKSPKALIQVFDDRTGRQIELDYRGTEEKFLSRLKELVGDADDSKPTGPGRPKLGVVSREIGLLPRHWEWLAHQPEGASAALRKLVEAAQKKNAAKDELRKAQEVAYRFMSIAAGDLPDFEEALRALYSRDRSKFVKHMSAWPKDIREHALKLSKSVFS